MPVLDIGEFRENLKIVEAMIAGDWQCNSSRILNDATFNVVVQFCKENIYFAYKLIIQKDCTKRDLFCIENRQREDAIFGNLVIKSILKMCGVLFKDTDPTKRPRTRKFSSINYIRKAYEASEMEIIYPRSENFSLPSDINTKRKFGFDYTYFPFINFI